MCDAAAALERFLHAALARARREQEAALRREVERQIAEVFENAARPLQVAPAVPWLAPTPCWRRRHVFTRGARAGARVHAGRAGRGTCSRGARGPGGRLRCGGWWW